MLFIQYKIKRLLPECGEDLSVDALQYILGYVQLNEKHDEDTMVWQLLELGITDLMVLQQHTRNNTQNLWENAYL